MNLKQLDDFLRSYKMRTDWIIRIKYKYDWEKEWHYSNEYLMYESCDDDWSWLSDWDEGQQNVEYIGAVPVDEIPVPLFIHVKEDEHGKKEH